MVPWLFGVALLAFSARPVAAGSVGGPSAAPPASSSTSSAIESSGRPLAVLDPATLWMSVAGQARKVRFVGLRAPVDLRCLDDELRALVPWLAADLGLEAEPSLPPSGNGMLLRYVSSEGHDVGAEMVRRGLALALPRGYARADVYRQAEERARAVGVGLWKATCAATREETAKAMAPRRGGLGVEAREAIALLHQRNVDGLNTTQAGGASGGEGSAASTARLAPTVQTTEAPGGDRGPGTPYPRPGEARSKRGPVVRNAGRPVVTVEGSMHNPGETEVRGSLRVEVRSNGSLVDSAILPMTLPPGGEVPYAVTLTPGANAPALTAVVTWRDR